MSTPWYGCVQRMGFSKGGCQGFHELFHSIVKTWAFVRAHICLKGLIQFVVFDWLVAELLSVRADESKLNLRLNWNDLMI